MYDAKAARMLTRYNAWSNKIWYAALAALPEIEPTRSRPSLFKNMVHTMNHIYIIDLIWQAHLEGRDHGLAARNTPDHPSLSELTLKHHELNTWFVYWSDQQTDDSVVAADRTRDHYAFAPAGCFSSHGSTKFGSLYRSW